MWVIKEITWDVIGGLLTCKVITDSPAHLWLMYSLYAPSSSPRWVEVRGTKQERGFGFYYQISEAVEQSQPANTTEHTFTPHLAPIHPQIHYFFADSPISIAHTISSPPLRLPAT